MKAVRYYEFGGPSVLRYEDVDRPEAGKGQVLVKVAGSAFSPADAGIRAGTLPIPVQLPHTPGYDVSGTVESVGAGVESFAVGDTVVGFIPMTATGAAAEFVVAPADALVKAPSSIPLVDAAALPSVALTAWQALFVAADLTAGQRVLIVGAGGTVGEYAVQLAKRVGAHVIATVSPRSRGSIERAGADEIIDYTRSAVIDNVGEQVDVLLNLAPIDQAEFVALVGLVRDGGIVVSTTAWMPAPGDEARNVRSVVIYVQSDAEVLTQLVALVDGGELSVDVSERLPLSALPAVHERAAAGTLRGKVVFTPASA
jgi:NADPH:quinone reductase-like Zn-dependent oxidoreductase